jgi:hypothetical protein
MKLDITLVLEILLLPNMYQKLNDQTTPEDVYSTGFQVIRGGVLERFHTEKEG